MGFQGNRIFLIAFIIVVFLIIVVWASASSSGSRNGQPAGVCIATINGAVGISQIEISNQNLQTSFILTPADFPYPLHLNKGDTLAFNVTTVEGYVWNGWELNHTPWFTRDNPLVIKVSGDITFAANCIVK